MKRITSLLLAAFLAVAGPAFAAAPPNPPGVSVVGGNASLSVSGVTARVALPVSTTTFPAVTLVNDGTTEVFWQGGDTSVVATTGNYPLQPGRFISVWLGNATNIAAITAGGSSTLRVIQFNGASTMGGAPDGSGAGGTVTLGAGSAIAGKFGIDQTTPGTTNGVQVNAALPAGTNLIGKTGIDQTTPGTTNGVQVNAALPAGTNLIGKTGIDQTTPGTTNGVQVNAALPAGTNLIGKTGIDQTTPGTTNGVQVNAALPAGANVIGAVTQSGAWSASLTAGTAVVGTVGGTDDRLNVTPTVQNASYASGNDIGGLVSFTLPRTASGILNAINIAFVGGATTSITAYCFDANPSGSTFTDKGTFTLVAADLASMIMPPQVLVPAVQGIGSAVTFATAANLARMFKSTTTIYCAYVSGGTFTPATVSDMRVSVQYDLNAN